LGEKTVEIDSRPSDALAVAVRAEAPIFAEEDVMEKAGVLLDKESGNAIVGSKGAAAESGRQQQHEPRAPVGKEELKKLSAFEDFIESLDMGGIEEGGGEEPNGKE
jgi:hypothetical protein